MCQVRLIMGMVKLIMNTAYPISESGSLVDFVDS